MSAPYCDICGVVDDQHNNLYCRLIHKDDQLIVKLYERIKKYDYALKRIRDCDFVITLPDRMDAVRAIAREALE